MDRKHNVVRGNDGFGYEGGSPLSPSSETILMREMMQKLVDKSQDTTLPMLELKAARQQFNRMNFWYGSDDSDDEMPSTDDSGSGSETESENDSICPSYQLDVAEYFQRTINQMQPAAVAEAEDVPRRCTWHTIRLKEMPQNPKLSHEAKVTDIVQDASAGMQEDRN